MRDDDPPGRQGRALHVERTTTEPAAAKGIITRNESHRKVVEILDAGSTGSRPVKGALSGISQRGGSVCWCGRNAVPSSIRLPAQVRPGRAGAAVAGRLPRRHPQDARRPHQEDPRGGFQHAHARARTHARTRTHTHTHTHTNPRLRAFSLQSFLVVVVIVCGGGEERGGEAPKRREEAKEDERAREEPGAPGSCARASHWSRMGGAASSLEPEVTLKGGGGGGRGAS